MANALTDSPELLRLGIDLDGVVADFNGGWMRRYNVEHGTSLDPDHVIDEYYAECFALYQTNADLLRRIRPHVFAFFQTDLPK